MPTREGYEYIGHVEYNARGEPTAYAIEVPAEHRTAWLEHVRKRFPGAWCQRTWSDNFTVMAWYDGTPENRIVREPWKEKKT